MEIDYVKLGKRIRRIREDRELSQEKLAKKIGVSMAHMSNIENGKTKFSLPVLISIADTLGVTPDVLLLEQVNAREKTRGVLIQQVDEQLAECDEAQIFMIEEIVHSAKKLMVEYEKRVRELKK
ncbi:MAG: helix-turn-helix transcriptional regulator [Lachnospiraceae bacterium]|nr:helix-turn-helix transcriptional regulator [Lachnospiraceae bacterium]